VDLSRGAHPAKRQKERERESERGRGGGSPWPRVYIAAEILFSLVGKQKLSSKATVLHFHLVSPFSTLCISEFAISFSLIPRGEKLPAQVRRNFRNYRPRGIDKPFLFSSSNFLPLSLSLSLCWHGAKRDREEWRSNLERRHICWRIVNARPNFR